MSQQQSAHNGDSRTDPTPPPASPVPLSSSESVSSRRASIARGKRPLEIDEDTPTPPPAKRPRLPVPLEIDERGPASRYNRYTQPEDWDWYPTHINNLVVTEQVPCLDLLPMPDYTHQQALAAQVAYTLRIVNELVVTRRHVSTLERRVDGLTQMLRTRDFDLTMDIAEVRNRAQANSHTLGTLAPQHFQMRDSVDELTARVEQLELNQQVNQEENADDMGGVIDEEGEEEVVMGLPAPAAGDAAVLMDDDEDDEFDPDDVLDINSDEESLDIADWSDAPQSPAGSDGV